MTTPVRPRVTAGGNRSASIGLALTLTLFVGFFALYFCSIDPRSVNIGWYNFVFDADIARVLVDAVVGQNPVVYERHPLFLLVVAPLAGLMTLILGDGPEAMLAVVSAFGALGVVVAHAVFFHILRDRASALLFAFFYGFAATTWLLSSVVETFALNSTAIALCFLLHRKHFGRPLRAPGRFALSVLHAALSVGVTVSNAVYVFLAYVSNSRLAQSSWKSRGVSIASYGAAVAGTFLILSGIQLSAFPNKIHHPSGLTHPLAAARSDAFLDFGRAFESLDALRVARAFLVDNWVAPRAAVRVVETVEGPIQMIQSGDFAEPGHLLALALLAVFVGLTAARARPSEVLRAHTAQVAGAAICFNGVFHYFYRANGEPFIFSIHTVLPLLVLLAHLYAASVLRHRLALGGLALIGLVANNAAFVGGVRDALEAPCAERVQRVCVRWTVDRDQIRFGGGLDAYTDSAYYWSDRGTDALEQGRPKQAAQLYQRAIEMDPGLVVARGNLGLALFELERHAESVPHLEFFLRSHPNDRAARRALLRARREIERARSAD